jgi:nucleosome binding factor SPN SPT16 subunit
MGNKNFDMVFVMKDLNGPNPTRMISAVEMKDIDEIQEWLTNQDITYTVGTINFNWKNMIATIKGLMEDGVFWEEETEDNGEVIREPGWLFLNAAADSEDEEEDDEDAEEYKGESDEEEESSEYSDDDDESDFEDEEEESEYDESEEEEAEGQSWEELEEEARAGPHRTSPLRFRPPNSHL